MNKMSHKPLASLRKTSNVKSGSISRKNVSRQHTVTVELSTKRHYTSTENGEKILREISKANLRKAAIDAGVITTSGNLTPEYL